MFWRKRRAEKQAEQQAQRERELREAIVDMLDLAAGGPGVRLEWPLILKPGERLVYCATGTGLFEPRREPGHWAGRSAGFSVPLGKSGIRYRVGKSAGSHVQGEEKPTIIDRGDTSFTTQRVVFQGTKYTREWPYSKLIGIVHYSDQPATAIQVSNRQKTSGILYTGLPIDAVRLRLAVAVEIFNGESEEAARQLHARLAELDSSATTSGKSDDAGASLPGERTEAEQDRAGPRSDPAGGVDDSNDAVPLGDSKAQAAPPNAIPGRSITAAPPAFPPPTWAPDPSGRHQLRFWDGNSWTELVSDRGQQSKDPLAMGGADTSISGDSS
jgi:hypothetical protein